jgi:LmbE family N-acetylglucosaminyl deacetylase
MEGFMSERKRALALMAHPDDTEFMCAGTLALLKRRGWEIHIGTMTPGDCGSEVLPPEQISGIRCVEAANSVALLGGVYHCLNSEDGFIAYDRQTILRTIALVRKVRPAVMFTHSPCDYLIDHEMASALARNAAFFAGVPNVQTEGAGPFRPVPHLYYVDAVDFKDCLGQPIDPRIIVDISSEIETKTRMLSCHASQRHWLRQQHGVDEFINRMHYMSKARGELIDAGHAEGFRQHLGHGYPADNLLAAELENLVHDYAGTYVELPEVASRS